MNIIYTEHTTDDIKNLKLKKTIQQGKTGTFPYNQSTVLKIVRLKLKNKERFQRK